ncbi:MAG: hypothetical protein DRH11_12540 [Deltaproteobacteria bacterium]|nr:MAG: hypothetical protein DRH11_12540 [Deltaproteobacteria bacterium]
MTFHKAGQIHPMKRPTPKAMRIKNPEKIFMFPLLSPKAGRVWAYCQQVDTKIMPAPRRSIHPPAQ